MSPVIVSIGAFEIRWYSVLMLVAIFIGLFLVKKEAQRLNLKYDFIFNMCFWAVIVGYICARLYYVLFNLEYYGVHPEEIFMVWKGGLAIHGGLIGGLLTMLFYCNKYKTRLIRYLDVICVPLILGQAIGRWGNFFNQEAHGAATTYEHLKSLHIPKFIIDNMKIDGVYYTPTFLYESIACLTLFIIFIIIRRYKFRKVGTVSALYLIGYGIIRFFIEISRTDALLILGFKIAQIVSIIMIIIGIIILAKNKKKGRFEDLYNDSNNVDNLKF